MDFENLFSNPPNPTLGKRPAMDSDERIHDEIDNTEVEETQEETVNWDVKLECEQTPRKRQRSRNSTESQKNSPGIKSRSKDYDPESDNDLLHQDSEDNFAEALQQYIQAKEMASAAQALPVPEDSLKDEEETQNAAKQTNPNFKADYKNGKQKRMRRKWPRAGNSGLPRNQDAQDQEKQQPVRMSQGFINQHTVERKGKQICKYFLERKCIKGDQCKFDHDAEIEKKREMCKFYVQGYCTRGEDCLFLHNEYPCKFYHTGAKCYQGEYCKFSHAPLTAETQELLAKSAWEATESILPAQQSLASCPSHIQYAKTSENDWSQPPDPERVLNTAALRMSKERLIKSQGQSRLPKRRMTKLTVCTFNVHALASDEYIEDLIMEAQKIKYDIIGLTETRRYQSYHAVFDTGEELFLGTGDDSGIGGVGVLVNAHLAMSIGSFKCLTSRIARLHLNRYESLPAVSIFIVYAPTSTYREEEMESFYMELEEFYKEDHTFYKIIVGDFNAKIGPRRSAEELHIGTHGLEWNEQGERLSEFIMSTKTIHGNSQFQKAESERWTWESPNGQFHSEIDHIIVNQPYCLTDVSVVPKFQTGSNHRLLRAKFYFTHRGEKAAKYKKRTPRMITNWEIFSTIAAAWEDTIIDDIDEEYNRLVQHLHDCAKNAEREKDTKGRLSSKTLELIRQRGKARASGDQMLTSKLAKQCREAIKEDLKERRAAVLADAAEAGKSVRDAHLSSAKMTALRCPDGSITSSRKTMEKIIHDFYSDFFDSHVHLPTYQIPQDGYVVPNILPSEIQHAISSEEKQTAPGTDKVSPEHLKNLPPVLINTLARLFTRYLSECKVPSQWKTSRTVLMFKKGDIYDIGNYRPICLLSVIYKLFTRVILNRIGRILDERQSYEQAGFQKEFSTVDYIQAITKLIEVCRKLKMPLCLTFIDLKKAFDSVETEAVIEALVKQGVQTQYIMILRELYYGVTTRISPFYNELIIDVKRGLRQGDTISPKLFSTTLDNVMRQLEWEGMGVSIDGRQLHHLRFADDIILIAPNISQAAHMLADFDHECGKIGLQLNLSKTVFMKNELVSDAPFTLNGTNISECFSYVYLGQELNMMNDLAPELCRSKEESGVECLQWY